MRCEVKQEDGGGPALSCRAAPPDESTGQAVSLAGGPGQHKFKSNRHFNRTYYPPLPPVSCRDLSGNSTDAKTPSCLVMFALPLLPGDGTLAPVPFSAGHETLGSEGVDVGHLWFFRHRGGVTLVDVSFHQVGHRE